VKCVRWTFGLLSPPHEQVSCNQSEARFGGPDEIWLEDQTPDRLPPHIVS
jgi:hypothetical protein